MSLRKNAFEKAEAAAFSVRVFVEGMRCHLAAISRMESCTATKVGSLKRIYAKLDWRDQQSFKGMIRRAASTLIGAEKDILLDIIETKGRAGSSEASTEKAGPGRPRKKLV